MGLMEKKMETTKLLKYKGLIKGQMKAWKRKWKLLKNCLGFMVRMEKKTKTTIMGFKGTTIRLHSFHSLLTKR